MMFLSDAHRIGSAWGDGGVGDGGLGGWWEGWGDRRMAMGLTNKTR